jgi:formamidopyrimidine-DNA glycosylase
MPELPDVETFRRYLEATALGQPIRRVRVEAPRVLEGVSAKELDRRLEGKAISRAERHGKVLFAHAGAWWIVFRFGMTGFLHTYRRPSEAGEHERVIFDLRNGAHLAFDCQRMFGRIGLTPEPATFIQDHHLGPDARIIGLSHFVDRVAHHRGAIKAALMDQALVAGVGNVYADEILFQARIHPRARVRELDGRALGEVHRAMKRVLERAIDAEADPASMPATWLIPVRGKGGHCPRCGHELEATTAGGRTTYACPRCQRRRDRPRVTAAMR